MTAPRTTDQLLEAFLAEGLTELPDRAYDGVRQRIHHSRQRVVLGGWSVPDIALGPRFGVILAGLVVLAVVAIDLRPGGGPGGVPSPSPSTLPSAAATPSAPTSFTSPFYGYAVTVPAGWVSAAAALHWDGTVEPGPFAETDRFAGPDSRGAWAYAGPFAGDLEALAADRIAATHRDHADTCPVVEPELREPLQINGQSWVLLGWNCGALINEALTLRGGIAYVFVFRDLAIRAATDPADRALFDSVLDSVVLPE